MKTKVKFKCLIIQPLPYKQGFTSAELTEILAYSVIKYSNKPYDAFDGKSLFIRLYMDVISEFNKDYGYQFKHGQAALYFKVGDTHQLAFLGSSLGHVVEFKIDNIYDLGEVSDEPYLILNPHYKFAKAKIYYDVKK